MDNIAGQKSALSWAVNLSVIFLVVIWLIPTVGLLVSSFRDRDQISASGWWLSPFAVEQNFQAKIAADDVRPEGAGFVIEGNLFEGGTGEVIRFGGARSNPTAAAAGGKTALSRGPALSVEQKGGFSIWRAHPFNPHP